MRERTENRGWKIEDGDPRSSILYPQRLIVLALLFALIYPILSSALDVPPLRGRVNDYAKLMPPERARALEERLARFEGQTGHQIAVLTILSLEGEDLEGFSIRVAERWKIGKKGFDNGAILLIAKNDRKLRIEVGYGLEGVLPDAIASRIIREVIVPRFRANDFAGGVEAGIEAIAKVTRGEQLSAPQRNRGRDTGTSLSWPQMLFIVFLLAFPAIGILASLNQQKRMGTWSARGRRRYDDGWGGGFGGGFGGSGGFSGGSGFGGGGGGFGGGGASGSW